MANFKVAIGKFLFFKRENRFTERLGIRWTSGLSETR